MLSGGGCASPHPSKALSPHNPWKMCLGKGVHLQILPQLTDGLLPVQRPKPRKEQGKPGVGAIRHPVGSRTVAGREGVGRMWFSEDIWVSPPPMFYFLSRQALPGARPFAWSSHCSLQASSCPLALRPASPKLSLLLQPELHAAATGVSTWPPAMPSSLPLHSNQTPTTTKR